MIFRLIGRLLLPLSSQQLIETLVDEVFFGISDGCLLLDKIEMREVFNLVYDKEIIEIYQDDLLLEDLKMKLIQSIHLKGRLVHYHHAGHSCDPRASASR